MKTQKLIARLDSIINLGNKVLETEYSDPDTYGTMLVDDSIGSAFRIAALPFIKMVYGEESPFYKEFNNKVKTDTVFGIKFGLEILNVVRDEIVNGWAGSFYQIVSGEIYSGFLDTAKNMLRSGNKDAAVVMIGGVVNEQLRQLATGHGIDIHNGKKGNKTAEILNDELLKFEGYGKVEYNRIAGWIDLWNHAVCGRYEEYNADQVKTMLKGVSEFVGRVVK